MQFNEYLKSCREHSNFTQEQLVHELYNYDIESFEGLETSTLSKWERGATKPKLSRQVNIFKYFQKITGNALPCLVDQSVDEAEELICKVGVRNLLGKAKELIYNFPSGMMHVDDMNIYPLRTSQRIDAYIENNMHIQYEFDHSFMHIGREQTKEWALHPSSLFLLCEHKENFLGLFFSLKIKPEVSRKIVNLEMKTCELCMNDFADADEKGSILMLSFFALNEKAASVLFIRFFAHLIANQQTIAEIGVVTINEDAKKIISRMNLPYYTSMTTEDNVEIQSSEETLPNVLASEHVLKMILSKQESPEE